jgi:hypothetical protein
MKIQSLNSSRYIRVIGATSIHVKPRKLTIDLDKVSLVSPDIINNSGKPEDPPYIYAVAIWMQGGVVWIHCEDDDEMQNIYDRLTELLVNYAGINIVNTTYNITHAKDKIPSDIVADVLKNLDLYKP